MEPPLVWVQDYQLLLVPQILRDAIPDIRVGLFLHTPFPATEFFRTLPQRKELLVGMLSADLLGFHIYDYARHFMDACAKVMGHNEVSIENDYIQVFTAEGSRTVHVETFSMGCDLQRPS